MEGWHLVEAERLFRDVTGWPGRGMGLPVLGLVGAIASAAYTAPVLAQPNEARVVIASDVACRARPDPSAPAVLALDVGDHIGAGTTHDADDGVWYLDTHRSPGCWVYGELVHGWSDPESALLAAVDRVLARTDRVPFGEFVAVDNFLQQIRAGSHADSRLIDESPLLQLRRLQLLARASRAPGTARWEVAEDPLMSAWFFHNRDVLSSHEPAGRWVVTADTFWRLYERHADTEWAEEIAWAATRGALIGDECDGACMLRGLLQTVARYWVEFPDGRWVDEAIGVAEEVAERAARVGCMYTPAEEARQVVGEIRASLAEIEAVDPEPLLASVSELDRSCARG